MTRKKKYAVELSETELKLAGQTCLPDLLPNRQVFEAFAFLSTFVW